MFTPYHLLSGPSTGLSNNPLLISCGFKSLDVDSGFQCSLGDCAGKWEATWPHCYQWGFRARNVWVCIHLGKVQAKRGWAEVASEADLWLLWVMDGGYGQRRSRRSLGLGLYLGKENGSQQSRPGLSTTRREWIVYLPSAFASNPHNTLWAEDPVNDPIS